MVGPQQQRPCVDYSNLWLLHLTFVVGMNIPICMGENDNFSKRDKSLRAIVITSGLPFNVRSKFSHITSLYSPSDNDVDSYATSTVTRYSWRCHKLKSRSDTMIFHNESLEFPPILQWLDFVSLIEGKLFKNPQQSHQVFTWVMGKVWKSHWSELLVLRTNS